MSVEHMNAVMDLSVGKSSLKFLLLVLANMANPVNGEFYPSVKYLSDKTEMNRKTILAGLKELQEMGIIEDTGKRDGMTSQVIVYRFTLNSAENGTVPKTEQSQKVTETVPILDGNSTVFSVKQSQKRDTETKGNIKETKGTKSRRATRLPPYWRPSVDDINYCKTKRPDLDVESVAERFRNYWTAKSGRDATKLDWHATWRNWVMNERQQCQPKKSDDILDYLRADYASQLNTIDIGDTKCLTL